MRVFKTVKKVYFTSELKNWVLTLFLVLLLFFAIRFFKSITQSIFIVGIMVLVLLKLRDFIVPFHVKKIKIDEDGNQLIFVLKSIMSGKKIIKYNLDGVKSELIEDSGLKKFFNPPLRIRIITSTNERFEIGSRYGFSVETLKELHHAIGNQTSISLLQ